MTKTRATLLLSLALFSLVSLPAAACGGGSHLSWEQGAVLKASLLTAPLLAALLVDRGAFALGTYALGLKRRMRLSPVAPLLAVAALFTVGFAMTRSDLDMALAGLALVPLAAAAGTVSFLRSVFIEMRGQPRAQLLRLGAVLAFAVLALVVR
jgi:hypothetical protein